MKMEPALFTTCLRCGAACIVDPKLGSKAAMLKRSSQRKGLCINCAVHDVLRHLYPANLDLMRSGPLKLLVPEIQRLFYEVVKGAGTDAAAGEIDWRRIVSNWNLPFPAPMRTGPMNPMSEARMRDSIEEERKYEAGRAERAKLTSQQYEAKRRDSLESAVTDLIRILDPDPKNGTAKTITSNDWEVVLGMEERDDPKET